MEPQTAARYRLLDELRGLDLISMMLYHGMWDVVFLFGVAQKWYTGRPGFVWAAEHLLGLYPAFGLLPAAGASSVPAGSRRLRGRGAGHSRHPALPARGRGVVRGADSAGLVHAPHRRAGPAAAPRPARRRRGRQRPAVLGDLPHDERLLEPAGRRLALPQALYASYTTAYLGFMPKSFFSTDYFPLLPWLFLFWAGYFLHHLVGRGRLAPLRRSVCPPLGWMGRHSLVLYLLHQPVILGVLTVAFRLVRAG